MQIHADRKLIRICLDHLLDNAWKFTRHRDPARIEAGFVTMDQKKVYFVRDNGVGFPGEKADRIFVAFEKLHDEETFPGHGVGLAIVKTVICRHGGSIWATSEPGKGACFYFTIGAEG